MVAQKLHQTSQDRKFAGSLEKKSYPEKISVFTGKWCNAVVFLKTNFLLKLTANILFLYDSRVK